MKEDTAEVFAIGVPITWTYTQQRPYKGDTLKEDRRIYLHIYYSSERAAEDEHRMTNQLLINNKIENINNEMF